MQNKTKSPMDLNDKLWANRSPISINGFGFSLHVNAIISIWKIERKKIIARESNE